jgi:hypothetical protein
VKNLARDCRTGAPVTIPAVTDAPFGGMGRLTAGPLKDEGSFKYEGTMTVKEGVLSLDLQVQPEVPAAGRPLLVRLRRGGTLDGVVHDASGRPVADAAVTAVGPEDPGIRGWRPEPARAKSDARGRFHLAGIGTGLQTVAASARGYAAVNRPHVRPGSSLDLTLEPGCWIVGTVTDRTGHPVGDARVRLAPSCTLTAPRPARARRHYERLAAAPFKSAP